MAKVAQGVGKRTPRAPSVSSWRALWGLSFMLGLLPLLWVTVSEGQTTSITSSGLGTTITSGSIDPAGRPNYIITGGTRPGDGPNLFHSFGDFSVGTNNVARFFNETGRTTTNILSRVTGGQTSNIYGAIQTAGFGTAALWLINPAGIVFGPSASLNVGGSVHFSTADYLRLGSGNDRFYADLGKTSQLTSAPVTAFGFLGSNAAGTISVQGGNMERSQTLSLVGRDRTVGDTVTPGIEVTGGTLSNPGGRINLISVGTPQNQIAGGEINATDFSPSPTLGFSSMGGVTLSQGATVHTNASLAGAIFVRGGQLVLDGGSSIQVKNGDGASPGIDIQVAGDVTLKNGAFLATETFGSGNGGNVTITAGDISLTQGSSVRTATLQGSGGKAGDIAMRARTLALDFGARISAETRGDGNAGNISITASERVDISYLGTLLSDSFVSAGSAGSITINTNHLEMKQGQITSSQTSMGTSTEGGSAGHITIQGLNGPGSSAQTLNLDDSIIRTSIERGTSASSPAGIDLTAQSVMLKNRSLISANTEGPAPGGNIGIESATLTMNPGTTITASTKGTGNAGDISITASDHVTISGPGAELATKTSSEGQAGQLNIHASQLTMTNGAMISGSSTGVDGQAGGAGAILIGGVNGPATNISLDNGSISSTISGGNEFLINSGYIRLTAQTIHLANGARITADTSGDTPAGSIELNVGSLATSSGVMISSRSTSTGASAGSAGHIVIQGERGESFAEAVTLDNSTLSATSKGGKFEFGGSSGQPGHISLLAQSISLENGTRIETDSGGGGFAGNILFQGSGAGIGNIATTNFAASNGVRVSTNSTGTADAGNISVVSGNISIGDSSISTSATQASGGNITLTAPNTVRLTNAQLTSSVSGLSTSDAGNISINTVHPQFVVIGNSDISANANEGRGGNIFIAPQYQVIQGNSLLLAKAGAGTGGRIDIIASRAVLIEPGTELNASAGPAGVSGTINIQAPIQQLSGAIAPLPQAFAVAINLYGQRCAAEKGGQFSSFVQGARDGVPPQPGDLIPSPLLLELEGTSPSLGLQSSPNLAAVRLGLPDFDHRAPVTVTLSAGCRS